MSAPPPGSGVAGYAEEFYRRFEVRAPLITMALILIVAVRIQELVPTLAMIRPALILSIGGLGYLFTRTPIDIWRSAFREPLVKLVIVFYAWAIVGVPFALYPGLAFESVTTPALTQLAVLVAPLLCAPTESNLRWLQRAYVHGMSGHMLLAFAGGVMSGGRLFTFGGLDSNDYSAMAAITFLLGAGLLQSEKKGLWRILAFVSMAILAIGVVRNGSRGGTLALIFGALVFLVASRGTRRFVYAVLFVVGAIAVWNVSPYKFRKRMIDLVSGQEDYNYTEYSGRKQVWARAKIYIVRHPAMGVGIANFPIMEGAYLEEQGKVGKWSAAHNAYYQSTVELGLPGGLMFISMLLIAIFKGWRLRRAFRDTASGEPLNRPEFVSAILAFSMSSVFLSHAYFYFLYGLLGLIAFAWRVAGMDRGAAPPLAPSPDMQLVTAAPSAPTHAWGRRQTTTAAGWRSRGSWPGPRGRFTS
ncbi:MAG: O-antigen ligase family protein [Gemmatimonadaceae bacterium]